jgi:iron complex outermembrane recepter protein
MKTTTLCSGPRPRAWSDRPERYGRALQLILSAAAFVALSAPLPSQAADSATQGASDSTTLAEVIVTAERRTENLQDVPISTSVINNDTLIDMDTSGQDVRVLAFKVPSLNIESSNGRTFPRFYIRGYGNTDFSIFASQPVELVYDDVVQENPILKGFPAFDMADVEVLRGPQGTLFGRNSPAGVVKFQSVKPTLNDDRGYFNVSDGTFETTNAEGAVNIPINSDMAARVSVQEQHRNNWVNDPINDTHLEGYNDWAGRMQLLFQPTDDFNALFNVHIRGLDASARLFRANIIQPGTNDLIAGFNPDTIYTDGANTQNLRTVGSNARLTWKLGDLSLFSVTGYETIRHYFTQGDIDGGFGAVYAPPYGPGLIPFAVETSGGISTHKQLSQEFRFESEYRGPLNWQAGIYILYEDIFAPSIDYAAPAINYGNGGAVITDDNISRQTTDDYAVFGSMEYAITSDFRLRSALRGSEDYKRFGVVSEYNQTITGPSSDHTSASKLNWDVSGTYQVALDFNVYARAATGFRAPSFGQPSPLQGIQVAKSEDVTSYETGFKSDLLDHRARLNFDIYYFNVKNQQLTAVGGLSNTTLLLNAKQTIGRGAELEFNARPTSQLVVRLTGSYNYTRLNDPNLSIGVCASCTVTNPTYTNNTGTYAFINGNPLPQAPKWITDGSVRYNIPLSGDLNLYAYADASYRSTINIFLYESKEFTSAPLFEGGLRFGYQWSGDKYDIAVFCRNCTNEIRVTGAIDFDNLTGFINDPRIIGAQFGAKF